MTRMQIPFQGLIFVFLAVSLVNTELLQREDRDDTLKEENKEQDDEKSTKLEGVDKGCQERHNVWHSDSKEDEKLEKESCHKGEPEDMEAEGMERKKEELKQKDSAEDKTQAFSDVSGEQDVCRSEGESRQSECTQGLEESEIEEAEEVSDVSEESIGKYETAKESDGENSTPDIGTDKVLMDDNAEEDKFRKMELDPELENVPLREILLKLKPEGLTDDEDEQPSDYSVTESSLSDDVEVEEEVLVSSGSAEQHEQSLDVNTSSTSDRNNSGNGISSSNGGSTSKKAVCSEVNSTNPVKDVEIINATILMKVLQGDPNITSRSSPGPCHLVYFFSPYCPFSVVGSPYVNALARSVPNIPVYGMDSVEFHSVNARYGVMGTPTLLLFHNGNGAGRYNASEYSVSQLISFINHYTDQEIVDINVTSSDFRAKLPSQVIEARPYALWAAWTFLLSCALWLFLTSDLCARLTEAILNNWREAEAQNDHHD